MKKMFAHYCVTVVVYNSGMIHSAKNFFDVFTIMCMKDLNSS